MRGVLLAALAGLALTASLVALVVLVVADPARGIGVVVATLVTAALSAYLNRRDKAAIRCALGRCQRRKCHHPR